MMQRSGNRGAIPAAVASTLATRLAAGVKLQRLKVEYRRVYGRERGDFEHAGSYSFGQRVHAARALRAARAICRTNGVNCTNAMFDLSV